LESLEESITTSTDRITRHEGNPDRNDTYRGGHISLRTRMDQQGSGPENQTD